MRPTRASHLPWQSGPGVICRKRGRRKGWGSGEEGGGEEEEEGEEGEEGGGNCMPGKRLGR
jgi:hypothetical protein